MVDYMMSGDSARYNIRKYLGVPADTPIKRALSDLAVPVREKHKRKGKACDAKKCPFSLAIHDITGSLHHAVFRTVTWALMNNPRTGAPTLYYWQTPQIARDLLGLSDAGMKGEWHPPFIVTFPVVLPSKDLKERRKTNKAYRERIKAGAQVKKRKSRKVKFNRGRVSTVKIKIKNTGNTGKVRPELIMPVRPIAPRAFGATTL